MKTMWMGVARVMVMVMAMARTIRRAGIPRTPWGSSGALAVAASGRDLMERCKTVAGTFAMRMLGS